MPPCTPEKNYNEQQIDEHTSGTQFGYSTPPQSTSKKTISKEEQHIEWLLSKLPTISNFFDIHEKIGEGTFSAVFLGTLKNNQPSRSRQYAIKHLVPTTHPKRIEVELHCLKQIGGVDNVVGLDLCVRENDNIVLVMPYMRYDHFLDYSNLMKANELRSYLKNLLKAVARVHTFGIIHRDVKPNNFLYDRKNKSFLLIDFGLAQLSQRTRTKGNESAKRKRDDDNETTGHIRKRQALHTKNLNNLNDTISYLQNRASTTKTPTKTPAKSIKTPTKTPAKKTPTKSSKTPRRSPRKHVSSKFIFKQPEKETLKVRGKRKLFETDEKTCGKELRSGIVIKEERTVKKDGNVKSVVREKVENVCRCYGRSSICNICIVRKAQEAARAGTPGFRPPEVLLKFANQTTAVDIWAVGIIMLCIMSRTYPFFRAPDDITALAEMIAIFGDEPMKKLAKLFGKKLLTSAKKPPLNLRKICQRLRNRTLDGIDIKNNSISSLICRNCGYYGCVCGANENEVDDGVFPVEAYDLLERLLDINPFTRITAEEALKHSFLSDV